MTIKDLYQFQETKQKKTQGRGRVVYLGLCTIEVNINCKITHFSEIMKLIFAN